MRRSRLHLVAERDEAHVDVLRRVERVVDRDVGQPERAERAVEAGDAGEDQALLQRRADDAPFLDHVAAAARAPARG